MPAMSSPGLTPEQRAALGRLRAIYDPAVLAERIGIGTDTLAVAVEGELHPGRGRQDPRISRERGCLNLPGFCVNSLWIRAVFRG